jgi:hypothetical protein
MVVLEERLRCLLAPMLEFIDFHTHFKLLHLILLAISMVSVNDFERLSLRTCASDGPKMRLSTIV